MLLSRSGRLFSGCLWKQTFLRPITILSLPFSNWLSKLTIGAASLLSKAFLLWAFLVQQKLKFNPHVLKFHFLRHIFMLKRCANTINLDLDFSYVLRRYRHARLNGTVAHILYPDDPASPQSNCRHALIHSQLTKKLWQRKANLQLQQLDIIDYQIV